MALIPLFHVVADEYDVKAGETIKMGQVVALDANGEVILCDGAGDAEGIAIGLAGDTKASDQSYMPGVGSSVTGSNGAQTVNFQNRASDYFDETKASGKMTVYHSGGKFATDMFTANAGNAAPGTALYCNGSGNLDTADAGSGVVVARSVAGAANYPSGVPGTDINGDQALSGSNSAGYMEIKLVI